MKKQITNRTSSGVTLIELLVVISVLVVLMALMVPRVRMVTKDRSIRESARIVGAALNEASSKATVDGFAGIAIARNRNVFRDDDPNNTNIIYYAAYQMFQLRQPPSFVGNEIGDTAQVFVAQPRDFSTNTPGSIEILFPLPFDPNINVDRGYVRLNGAKTRYRIIPGGVRGPNGGLLCEVPFHLEMPAEIAGAGVPFELIREPVLRQTSQIDLPRGYMINLNYSGPIDFFSSANPPPLGSIWDMDDWSWTAFSQSVPAAFAEEPIYIIFNDQGGIDRIYPYGFNSQAIIPNGSVHLCVAPDDVKHTFQPNDLSGDMIDGQPSDVLDDTSVMWVSINHTNGSVSVTDTTRPTTLFLNSDGPEVIAAKKASRLLEALQLTGKRQAATQ